ncbi:hypothetical protein M2447_001544 [Ereboglobus sp. PH5-10]|uniref:hypothetical protein n=1 Tax=Ereboglobus sp. PH5-10 TaxID=2940629 RepID=UPI0024065D12|nr:hypothetical protein [Ereboglobus sp. PH5-10]MDF9827451.1 hypothetical protein [Ereboglobus sp. PH5-10]
MTSIIPSSLRSALCALALGAAACLASAPVRAANLAEVPDENAPVIIMLRDIPEILRLWEKTPIAALINDPELSQFNDQMNALRGIASLPPDAGGMDEITAIIKQVSKLAPNAIVALADTNFTSPEMFLGSLIVALDLGTGARETEKQISTMLAEGKWERRVEDYFGLPINIEVVPQPSGGESITIYWTVLDSTLIASCNREHLHASIDRVKRIGKTISFAMSARHSRMMGTIGMAQIAYAANIKSLFATVKKAASEQLAKNPESAVISMDAIESALGIDAFGDAFFGVILDNNEMQIAGACTHDNPHGLLRLLAPKAGSLPRPPFLPQTLSSVSISNFDAAGTFATVKASVQQIAPFVGALIDAQINNLNQNMGVNLENDLLVNIDGCMITGMFPPAKNSRETSMFLAFPLKKPEAFTAALGKLIVAGGLPEKTRQLGDITIRSVSNGTNYPGSRFEYAIVRNYFLAAGGTGGIDQAVRCWAGQSASVWTDPRFVEMADTMPGNLCGISRYSLRDMARLWFVPAGTAVQRAAIETRPADPGRANTPAPRLPSPSFDSLKDYQVYNYFYRKNDGTYFRTKITRN